MAKKKKEHVTFDNMLKTRKSIPFQKVNQQSKGKSFQQRRPQGR